ncbi:MAG: D-glycero-beta-D-manno-heptose-7-phosphate kinase [Ignavibacteriales bacterium]|nr:D-glycero-beta-D-manno-heptose-7-phosphate kinase [Ignavibacteriales bacterium]
MSSDRLGRLLNGFQGKRIAVIGDLMVDRYYWGAVSRISPEAPVPVVEVESQSTRLGGAANVANNIATLGGTPLMIGVVGDDDGGAVLKGLLEESGFSALGLIVDPGRPTTIKTRVIAHHQHVVRIDQEVKDDISPAAQEKILGVLKRELPSLDAVILQDYNKGVIVKELIGEVTRTVRAKGKIITVDPKFHNFFEYKNVTVFKPNRKESEEALGRKLTTRDSVEQAGWDMLRKLDAENLLLTLGEQGMSLFEKSGTVTHVSTRAKKVADVSGAGDTVISALTMSLVAGADIKEASAIANVAGGVVCGEVGIVPIGKQALMEALTDNHVPR